MCIALATSLQAVARCLHERVEFWFAVFALSAAWFYYPYCQTGPTLCIWRILLGVPCPGCGLTRGVCFLVHGKWAEAIRFNPLSLLAIGIFMSNILYEVFGLFANYRRGKGPGWSGQERSGGTSSENLPEPSTDWNSVRSEGL